MIGYSKAAEIAKVAYQQGRPVIDAAEEMTELSCDELSWKPCLIRRDWFNK